MDIRDCTEVYENKYPIKGFKTTPNSLVESKKGLTPLIYEEKNFIDLDESIINWLYELVGTQDLMQITFGPVNLLHCANKSPKYPITIMEFEKGVYTALVAFIR